MTEDLQQLLEKIQRDGVDKAQSEADVILKDAKEKAAALIKSAQDEALKAKSDAQSEADASAARAEETIRQTARDILLDVEKSVTALLEALLLKDVKSALNSEQLAGDLVQDAVKAYISGSDSSIEVATTQEMAEALRSKLAAEAAQGVTVVTDKTTGSGFRVKLADGRIEHDFTGTAVADALARQLRPGLAALLKS